MGKLKDKVGTAIISAAIIDDVIGIILLTFVIGLKDPSKNSLSAVFNTLAFFALKGIGGLLINYLFKYLDKRYGKKCRVPIYGFALCLLLAYVAEHFFGIADITVAYVAGIILCNIKTSDYIVEKIDTSSYLLFSHIFFTSIGLKAQISSVLIFSIGFVLAALLSKLIGCSLGATPLILKGLFILLLPRDTYSNFEEVSVNCNLELSSL